MSTTGVLSSIGKMFTVGGVLPRKKRSPAANRVLDQAYRTNVPKKGLRRNRLYKRPVVFKNNDLSDDFMSAFSSMGLIKKRASKKTKKDVKMSEAPTRRSARNRTQTERFSPTAAAKKDKDAAKKSKKTVKKSSKSRSASPKRRSRSSSTSPMVLDFMNLRL